MIQVCSHDILVLALRVTTCRASVVFRVPVLFRYGASTKCECVLGKSALSLHHTVRCQNTITCDVIFAYTEHLAVHQTRGVDRRTSGRDEPTEQLICPTDESAGSHYDGTIFSYQWRAPPSVVHAPGIG